MQQNFNISFLKNEIRLIFMHLYDFKAQLQCNIMILKLKIMIFHDQYVIKLLSMISKKKCNIGCIRLQIISDIM